MMHSIVGLMSSGKTLYMTYLLYCDYLRGRQIITNYPVNFPHILINRAMLQEMGEKNFPLLDYSIGLDELWIWMDSRKSMENTVLSYFFNQSSKDDVNIYYTAQENSQNDNRLRNNSHYLTICHREVKIGKSFYRLKTAKRKLDSYFVNGMPVNEILYISLRQYEKKNYYIFTDFVKRNPFREHLRAKKIIPLYDTTKKIRRDMASQETLIEIGDRLSSADDADGA